MLIVCSFLYKKEIMTLFLRLPEDTLQNISQFADEYQLLDWIPLEKLNGSYLSFNKSTCDILI
jgi:hypothetical protein